MQKSTEISLVIVAALAFTSVGFALAAGPNKVNSSRVIYACVNGINGSIVRVSDVQKTCPRGTKPISWNASGPKGDQGPAGQTGERGEAGPQGSKGDSGPTGPVGPQGLQGPIGVGALGSPLAIMDGASERIYPAFGNRVQIDENLWRLDRGTGSLVPIGNLGSVAEYFVGPNCSSSSVLVSRQNPKRPSFNGDPVTYLDLQPFAEDVYELLDSRGDSVYGLTLKSHVNQSAIQSWNWYGSSECYANASYVRPGPTPSPTPNSGLPLQNSSENRRVATPTPSPSTTGYCNAFTCSYNLPFQGYGFQFRQVAYNLPEPMKGWQFTITAGN